MYDLNHALDDKFLHAKLSQIIEDNKLEFVIETGIANGYSTVKFCSMANYVIGMDIDPGWVEKTRNNLVSRGLSNFELMQGNSPALLQTTLKRIPANKTLFFLDAHNGGGGVGYWPLPDEIKAIPRGQGILVFHDIKVPGKDYGFDWYFHEGAAHEFTYDLVRNVLTDWSPTHRIEYMTEADRNSSYRGAAIVYP